MLVRVLLQRVYLVLILLHGSLWGAERVLAREFLPLLSWSVEWTIFSMLCPHSVILSRQLALDVIDRPVSAFSQTAKDVEECVSTLAFATN